MNGNIKEEKAVEKRFDLHIIKRILKYAKPYTGLLILSFIMIVLATAADLARPYLMKVAIDDYISAYNSPMIIMDKKPETIPSIEYNGMYYVREKYLDKHVTKENNEAQLLKKNKEYYIVFGHIANEDKISIKSEVNKSNEVVIETPEDNYKGIKINKSNYLKFRKRDKKGLIRIGVIFLVVLIAGFIFTYLQIYILNYIGQKVIYSMREELFIHVQRLSLKFFDKNPVGRLVTRLTNDMKNINEMFTSVLVSFFKDILLIGGTMVIMLKMNFKVSLVCFSTIPIIILSTYLFRRKAREAHREVKAKLAKINSTLNENIMGMKIIQIFHKEKDMFEEFDTVNTEHKNANMKELLVFAIFRPSMDFIYSLTLSILIWFGGRDVIQGTLEFGVLFAFTRYIEQFFRPIFDLSEKFNILQSAVASSEKVFQLLDEEVEVKNIEKTKPIKSIKGEIEFKNVYFAYDKEWVLKDVSFKIKSGETAAFVGATGSGKTTIISLLSRLYDIQKGEILIDGKNIKEVDKYELRSHIGAVLQDVFVFTGNIKDNIRLSEKNINDEKIEQVSRFVNADKFIEKLPQKYSEEVMERGATLSAGQRQLLSFARALAFDPSILILDEATSNIDTETEGLIQDAISKVVKGRTTIVVAHRLSTVQHAEKIVVMHKGVIREVGNHEELLEKKGMYYDLYSLQYKEAAI